MRELSEKGNVIDPILVTDLGEYLEILARSRAYAGAESIWDNKRFKDLRDRKRLEEKAITDLHLDHIGKECFTRLQEAEWEIWLLEIVGVYKQGLVDAINLANVMETVEINEQAEYAQVNNEPISAASLDELAQERSVDNTIIKDPEYERIMAEMKTHQTVFEPQLDANGRRAWSGWDESWGVMSSLEQRYAYKRGYRDGFGQAKGLPLQETEEDATPSEIASPTQASRESTPNPL